MGFEIGAGVRPTESRHADDPGGATAGVQSLAQHEGDGGAHFAAHPQNKVVAGLKFHGLNGGSIGLRQPGVDFVIFSGETVGH